eukprot:7887481-Alexandrium_andersonii.AAC.1
MSASLVGSEMCIRDSLLHSAVAPQLGVTAYDAASVPNYTGLPYGHGRGAVSYTHLTLPTICSV